VLAWASPRSFTVKWVELFAKLIVGLATWRHLMGFAIARRRRA